MKRITSSDVFDINRKTGALILGKNRLDDYATKFLSKYCKQALVEPMPLPVDDILKDMGLKVQEATLSKNMNVFGCCALLDSFVDIYDHETNTSTPIKFEAGNILIDPLSETYYGEGSRRNTLIHEAIHWEKDRSYFKILKVKNKNMDDRLYPILCKQSEVLFVPPEGKNTKENEVKWLEWQAHRLAPRILMPKNSFKKKALEYIELLKEDNSNRNLSCDNLIDGLSEFFIVSRSTVKYRLLEVGLEKTISEFVDYDIIYGNTNDKKEYAKLTPVEAFMLLTENITLQKWVVNERFIFAEGYFVLADSQYVVKKDGIFYLTAKAKRDISKCVINIHEQSYIYYANINKDLIGFATLKKIDGIDKRLYSFHPKYQVNLKLEEDEVYEATKNFISSHDYEEEIELDIMIANPRKTLCDCLVYLMDNRKWNYPATFNEKTELHTNYFGDIKDNKRNNMGTDMLMAICIGLGLNCRMTEKLFGKSQNKLNFYEEPDKTYILIMENMRGLPMSDFNKILKKFGIQELGSKIKKTKNL